MSRWVVVGKCGECRADLSQTMLTGGICLFCGTILPVTPPGTN